jgi:endo-1,4-beta-xylanase
MTGRIARSASQRTLYVLSFAALASFLLAAVLPTRSPAAAPSDAELWKGADARIERHRKADATIALRRDGRPVADAKIAVRQTRHAFLFGSNIFVWGKCADAKAEEAYRKRFAELLNYATLPFYWPMYEPQRGRPNHEQTEQAARWCRAQGILTKGHPLAWNFAEPRWLPDDWEEVRRLQMARFDDCVRRFAGLIDRWDVVNEATHFDRDEFLRAAPKLSDVWKRLGRVEFTAECFGYARKAGPKATLLINDYRTDPAYERLIEKLVDTEGKRLYDVIGIQSHMHGGTWPSAKIYEVCDRFARFKVPLHFTETTILSGERGWERKRPWQSTPEGEAYQAAEVTRLYTMLFSHPAVEAVTWWDFSDYQAWQGAPAGFLRADMSPKPAYDALLKLVKQKWWTRAELTSDREGSARFRGFLGDYEATITAGGKTQTVPLSLVKTAENKFEIELK